MFFLVLSNTSGQIFIKLDIWTFGGLFNILTGTFSGDVSSGLLPEDKKKKFSLLNFSENSEPMVMHSCMSTEIGVGLLIFPKIFEGVPLESARAFFKIVYFFFLIFPFFCFFSESSEPILIKLCMWTFGDLMNILTVKFSGDVSSGRLTGDKTSFSILSISQKKVGRWSCTLHFN